MTVDEWGYCLMKKTLENSLASVVTGEHSRRQQSMKQEAGPHQTTECSSASILDGSASKQLSEVSVCCLSHLPSRIKNQ